MSILKRAMIVWLTLVLSVAPSYACYPVFDLPNTIQNTITSVESKIQSLQAVKQTVALLEEIAQLYALYNNAMKVYKSIGNAVDSVKHFGDTWKQIKNTWLQPINLKNFGQTLNSWGVTPDSSGPLGALNGSLSAFGNDVNKFSAGLGMLPQALSRDVVIGNIVRGVQAQQNAKGLSNGTAGLGLTGTQHAGAMSAAADASMAQLGMQLSVNQQWMNYQRSESAATEATLNADTNIDQTHLQLMNAQILSRSNIIAVQKMQQDASIGMDQSVSSAAIRAHLERESDVATAKEAVEAALSEPVTGD